MASLLSIGLNCATGPEFMTDHIRTLHEMVPTRISCYPNAGLPNEEGKYQETPESLASQLERFIDHGWLNLVGGCCGTTPAHIRAIAQMADGKPPRRVPEPSHRAYYSGIDLVEAEPATRPLIVGERTNVIGSRLFKRMIAEEKWEEASEIARWQVRNGAHIVDVCLQSSERDEIKDVPLFYDRLIRKTKAPIMIDTTDASAVELALTYCQGKAIINSVNLEDGEEKFQRICPMARAYGAALVVGSIDEDKLQAQAFTRERKLAVAERSFALLTTKYGIPPEDIIIDPLVFPCATGDENYIGGAVETMEAVRLIKERLPLVKTILGISNISFGLPAAAREVVNSVFLYHCTKQGLDLAIVNAEKLERFASIPIEERRLAENLLFNTPPVETRPSASRRLARADPRTTRRHQPVPHRRHHRSLPHHDRAEAKQRAAELPLDERLANYIIEGTKDGLIADLDRKRQNGAAPLDIINGPLMAGMSEVGRLFNNNELIVAEVLQSAEAMKAAVSHLEQFMEKADSASRGKLILATVKGDVHDIGKNLVEIILSNNGYYVINLGIKVPPEQLIRAFEEHQPDAIGLSGLLVKSAQQMVDHRRRSPRRRHPRAAAGRRRRPLREIHPPQDRPRLRRIAVCYAKDAMTGLRLMNELMDVAARGPRPAQPLEPRTARRRSRSLPQTEDPQRQGPHRHPDSRRALSRPQSPRRAALGRDLELHQPVHALRQAPRLQRQFRKAARRARRKSPGTLSPNGGNQARGRALHESRGPSGSSSKPSGKGTRSAFLPPPPSTSPARPREGGLCLSDYVLDPKTAAATTSRIFVVTAGAGIRERSEEFKRRGEYVKAHGLQALAIETAEACAEWLHRRLREDWGFPDPPTMTMHDRFTSRYRGKRYSPGYSACPNLDDQQIIWKLLRPDEIGVQLTDGMMMDPEASVSALVFHHPDCAYFTAGEQTPELAAIP